MFSENEQKFHDMTDEEFSIHRTRWNIIHIDDAKGLEFSSVIVLSGRMSRNQKYIAYTRALDDLYVYSELIDVKNYEKNPKQDKSGSHDDVSAKDKAEAIRDSKGQSKHIDTEHKKTHAQSAVRTFFEENGLEVVDNRDSGGRLWVIGEKEKIRGIVNEAISKFKISGKYATSKESNNRPGWYSKTDK